MTEKETYTERCNNILQAIGTVIHSLEYLEERIGTITKDDDYMFLELRFMTTNFKLNIQGFTQAKLNSEAKQGKINFRNDVYEPNNNKESK